jgi:outer membrane protein assembly factor BamB
MKINRWVVVCAAVILIAVGGIGALLSRSPPKHRIGRASGGVSSLRPESQPTSFVIDPSNEPVNAIAPRSNGIPVFASMQGANPSHAVEWSRFRGFDGNGISDDQDIPTVWNDDQNVLWKVKLPGPGASSPVLTDQCVFVTSYSGYGDESYSNGTMAALERQLNCVSRKDGKLLWSRSVKATLPEDPYQGMGIPEHGYATNSATTDGQSVFAFFGKSGVIAFDMLGSELWKTSVGTESGNRGWGTAASLILYKDLVIVNASEESQSINALDKRTGKVVWSAPASTLELAYGTPIIVKVNADRDDLVIAVPGEVWGLNPNTGKLVWYVETTLTGNLSPSVIYGNEMLYVFGGYRSSGSLAIRTGAVGQSTHSHVAWTSRNSSYVVTPVLLDEHLVWIDDQGFYFCVQAKTGTLVQKSRVAGMESRGRPVYASPVAIDGKLYMQTRTSGVFVLAGEPKLNILSQNKFQSDQSIFNATPAVSRGQLFLRSNSHLYCIGKK